MEAQHAQANRGGGGAAQEVGLARERALDGGVQLADDLGATYVAGDPVSVAIELAHAAAVTNA